MNVFRKLKSSAPNICLIYASQHGFVIQKVSNSVIRINPIRVKDLVVSRGLKQSIWRKEFELGLK